MTYVDPNDYWDAMPDDEKVEARRRYSSEIPNTIQYSTKDLKLFGFCLVCRDSGPVMRAHLVEDPLDDWICSKCLMRAVDSAEEIS